MAQVLNFAVGFCMTTGVFAMIYKIMPRVRVQWHDVWIGAAVTALLFTIGRFLIGLYIGKSGVASGFGAAGSLVVIFVWVYYSAQIFLIGAEFTWVYARTFGSMRNLTESAKEERESDLPARGEDAAPAAPPPVPLPGRTRAPAPRTNWRDVGVGVAVALALRYLVPRFLRRL